jgi:hypothetical protein
MFGMSFFTRAGTVIAESLSVGFSCDGSDFVVLPPQTQSAPAGSSSPSSGESSSDSVSDSDSISDSSYYDANDAFEITDDEWESDSECSVFLRTSRRAHVTCQQAQQIRNMHGLSLSDLKNNLKHRVPHVMWQGGTPNFSYWSSPHPTVPQTPVSEVDDGFLDEILDELYNGYRHITTLDLDDVPTLADLKSPTQPDLDFGLGLDGPLVQANWVDPYGIPAGSFAEHMPVCNVPLDSEDYPVAFHTLANSGLNWLTDYDVSDSPRKCLFEISAILRRQPQWDSQSCETKDVGEVLDWPMTLGKVSTRETLFVPFSYTNVWQPRTELARRIEGAPVSPKAMPPMSPAFGVMFEA